MTPYERHQQLEHAMTRYSPDSFQIIEECTDCGARFLHDPVIGYPVSLSYNSRGACLLRSVTKGQRVVWSPKTGWQDK